MVKFRRKTDGAPIRDVRFQNPRLEPLGLDVMTLDQLQKKAPPEHFAVPERLEFHLLMLISAGRGRHEVDFITYPLERGAVVHIQPKQVHRFHLARGLRGTLLLIQPTFLLPGLLAARLDDSWPVWSKIPPGPFSELLRATGRIASETAAYQDDPITASLLRHWTAGLLLEILRAAPARPVVAPPPGSAVGLLRIFKAQVEANFHEWHSLGHYARQTGYSEKTLTRACWQAEGRTAKAVIDARVALEAKRLLAHSGETVTAIGAQLGFSEATNFVKFFKRTTGQCPAVFPAQFGSDSQLSR